jgi:Cu2+-exporting ATPase
MAETTARRTCLLCATVLPEGAGERDAFCCSGCAAVHAVIAGLDEKSGAAYLAAARGLGIVPGATPSRSLAADLPPDPAAEREERFRADGMSCPSCAWVIERVLAAQEGVRRASFDFFTGTGRICYDMRRTSVDRLHTILLRLGYGLAPLTSPPQDEIAHGVTLGFAVCAVISMNLMCLSALRYAHDIGWIDVVPTWVPWVELLLALPVMIIGLGPIGLRAWQGLRRRRLTMDALISLSSGAAFVLSCAALLAGRSDIYFETAAGLVTITLLSRLIEARLRQRALAATTALMHLDIARVRMAQPDTSGREVFCPIGEVTAGKLVRLHKGELVPFDGETRLPARTSCLVSESVLTGEPRPVRKVAGDPIHAGSTVAEGELVLAVLRPFGQTRLRQVADEVRASLAAREGELRSADAITAWFVPAVLGLALCLWLARLALHGVDYALSAAGWFPSVLAVACPCAFSLAGATAVMAATWSLLSRGFLVRDPDQLQRLTKATTVVFDKTRTLTEGELGMQGLSWRERSHDELLPLVLAAEEHCPHPVAQALRGWLAERGIEAAPVSATVEDLPGQGRRLLAEPEPFVVGATALFDDRFEIPNLPVSHTLVWFGHGSRAEGCFQLTDRLRAGAAAGLRQLQQAGLGIELLSGDRQEVCDHLATELGIDRAVGGATLQAKVSHIQNLQQNGQQVVYVGDGTNDALAMSAASASVAMAGSTDEALSASGLVMLHTRLESLPELFATARKLGRVVRENYLWAMGWNGLFVPVAAAGLLTPLVAMLLMLISSTSVLLNSLRLLRPTPDQST